MMAQYNSCTEITTYSGNTKIYIIRKEKRRENKKEPTYKNYLKQQKLLGVALIVICIVGCILIPEDCGGFILPGLMGVARVIHD